MTGRATHPFLLPGTVLQGGHDYVALLALAYAMAPPCSPDERLLVGLLTVAKRRYGIAARHDGASCVSRAQNYALQLPELTDEQHAADLVELVSDCLDEE